MTRPRKRDPLRVPEHELTDRWIEAIWRVLSRWAVPVMMALAYGLLAASSETNATGTLWMSIGFGLVLTVWFVFRALAESAAFARALSIGDTARLFALAGGQAGARSPTARARCAVGRGVARLLRGEFADALAALDEAPPGPELQPLAAVVRIAARLELGLPPPDSRGASGAAVVATSRSPALAWLAEGQLAWHAGEVAAAAALCDRVIADMRAGGAARAIAHVYAARLADARGEPAAAARHRSAAAALAAPDARWLRAIPTP